MTLQLLVVYLTSLGSSPDGRVRQLMLASASLAFAAALSSLLLSCLAHGKSARPSGTLSLYFLVTVLLDAPIVRTMWLLVPRNIALASGLSSALFARLVLFLLETQQKRPLHLEGRELPTKEESAGIISRSLFWWLLGLMKLGYRNILSFSDLDPLESDIRVRNVRAKFDRLWQRSGMFPTLARIP